MQPTFLMGLDAGGGGGRCVLVNASDGGLVTTFCPWSFTPGPGEGWAFDFDLETGWRQLCRAARQALQQAQATPADVVGVAACSMRHGLVLLGAGGRPLLAVPNRDGRAATEGMELAEAHGQILARRSGHWPTPVFMASRLLWFFRNRPEASGQVEAALSLNEWLGYRMCAEVAAEASQAGESLLMDLESGAWAWDLVDRLGLPRAIFPRILPAGSRLGSLTPAAAEDLGLRPGIAVAVGGADTQAALLSVGAVDSPQTAAIAGTTTPVQRVLNRPLIDPDARLWTGAHLVPDRWVLESNGGSMGDALEWWARMLYPRAPRPVEALLAEAQQADLGSAGMLSTVGAQIMNGRQLALPMGNLTLSHLIAGHEGARRSNLARALLEGMAYGVRANLEQILAVDPTPLQELLLGGGLSRSGFWRQMVGDVVGRLVSAPVTLGASAHGAAICAGVGAGVFGSLVDGARLLTPKVEAATPDQARAARYQDLFEGWVELQRARNDSDGVAAALMIATAPSPSGRAEAKEATRFRPRILVTAEIDEASLARLRQIGEVEYASYRQAMQLLSGLDLVEALRGFEVFVTEVDVLDADALRALPDLRVVFACRGNVVNVDIPACTAVGVPVLSAPGRNAEAVADLTVAFILLLLRELVGAAAFLHTPGGEAGDMARMGQAHERFLGHELWGKTVGLVGMGAVGRGVAARLKPFGVRLLVHDPYLPPEQAALAEAESVGLEELLAGSDIVSLHAAVTDETRGLINAERLAVMKPGAMLVNTARAALVDEAAVLQALQSGHLGGAALDVFSVEPPGADHPLLQLPNVIATPHIGGNTAEVAAHQGQIVADGLESLLRGTPPANILNPQVLETFSWMGERRTRAVEVLAGLAARPAPAVTDLDQAALASGVAAAGAEAPAADRGPGLLRRGLSKLLGQGIPEPSVPGLAESSQGSPGGKDGASMEKLVELFLAGLAQDPKLIEYAKGPGLSMHYVLTDPALEFTMEFGNGKVRAGLGPPASAADVRLKMKAEIFDKMLSGQINATKAAMTGKLSFSGDTRKAMGMQKVQADMMRVYTQARQAVGAPSFGPVAGPTLAPAGTAAVSAPPPASPSLVGDERDELVAVIGELYTSGLITATGGNLSVRIPGKDEIWITPSALFKGDLRPELMVRLRLDGQVLDAEARSPSSEWRMHCAVYQARPDVEAVIHAHAPQATILTLSGRPFLPISTEAAFLGDVGRVPFIMPGTQELAQAVVAALGASPAVLLQNHGILVAGSSLRRAADMAEVLERTAEVILGCYAVGQEPPVLPDEALAALREVGKMMA